jgi:hypothetical protein
MLVKHSPDQVDLTREELDILLERQLVAMERPASGVHRPRLTDDGNLLLKAVTRGH